MAEAAPVRIKNATLWEILKQTVREWNEDDVPRMGAAMAYYAIFSIAPLFLVSLAIASWFVGEEAARGELHDRMQGYLGEFGAKAVEALVGSARRSATGGKLAVVIGIGTLLYGASGVFGQLKISLNQIWGVTERKKGIKNFLLNRLVSYLMVLLIGFLLVASAFASAIISTTLKFFGPVLRTSAERLHLVDLGLSFVILLLLFGIIFKVMPDVKLAWKNVWLGAAVTSILFSLGKMAIGIYIAKGSIANSYGAAGSLLVLMLWIYYSAQIVFFGAEFTQVYSKMRHIAAPPAETGVRCEDAVAAGEAPHKAEKATSLDA